MKRYKVEYFVKGVVTIEILASTPEDAEKESEEMMFKEIDYGELDDINFEMKSEAIEINPNNKAIPYFNSADDAKAYSATLLLYKSLINYNQNVEVSPEVFKMAEKCIKDCNELVAGYVEQNNSDDKTEEILHKIDLGILFTSDIDMDISEIEKITI